MFFMVRFVSETHNSFDCKMWKIILLIFALFYVVNSEEFPHELRHLKYILKEQLRDFGESCQFDCEYYRNWIPVVIMLNDTITSQCPTNLLDNNAIIGSTVMYKHWCPLLVTLISLSILF